VLQEPFLGPPGPALLSLSAQIVVLELVPISVGAWLQKRLGQNAQGLRTRVRQVATLSLVLSAGSFVYVYRDRLQGGGWLLGVGPFLLLSVGAWLGAWISGRTSRVDTAQVAGLRNISLALVLAASSEGSEESVVFVLVGAAVTTLLAPVLRAASGRRAGRPLRVSGEGRI
jgi:predicted Na+-dependent transporter